MKPLIEFFLILLLSAFMLASCAHDQNQLTEANNQKVVEFPYWYEGHLPDKDPETWDEHYNAGVWLFQEGKFPEALNHFLVAVDLTTGEAQRTCLTAAAVTALGAGDPRFNQLIDQLELTEPENTFREKTIIDQAIPVLKDIKAGEGGGHDQNS
jgi:hypothetical protein